jgi:hypothetical protein
LDGQGRNFGNILGKDVLCMRTAWYINMMIAVGVKREREKGK